MTIATEVKKVSICSIESRVITGTKISEKWADKEPTDRFYIVHILFILLGLMHMIIYSFFVTANAYWMYKFRDVTAETTNTDARTPLQTHFFAGCTITITIPMLFCILISTYFGHRIKARRRLMAALISLTLCFLMGSMFVVIDTDSWQTGFFALTMGILTVINGSNAVLQVAVISILSKFPQYYMKVFLVGEGFAGVFSASLQILSLALGTSTTVSASVYFLTGTSLMAVTLLLYYLSRYNALFNYHAKSVVEDTKRDLMPLSEMKMLFRRVWPCIVAFGLYCLTINPTHTPITSLVVSEDYGNGNLWNDKYFVPTITFLYSDFCSLVGRLLCSKIHMTIDGVLLNVIMFIRMMIFVPLIFFCNAQPRHHLPVLLPHDYQYILVMGAFNFTNGYLLNLVYLDTAKLAPEGKVEGAFLIMISGTSIIAVVTSTISLYAVDVL